MSKSERTLRLVSTLVLAALLIVTLGGGLARGSTLPVRQTGNRPVDEVITSQPASPSGRQLAPEAQRAAPYGQYIVTHNNVNITSTAQTGVVARTSGYDYHKAILCDVGATDITGTLYARISSTGNVFTLAQTLVFPANTRTYSEQNYIAPWMTLSLTGSTGSTTTCGIWVQTP